MFGELPEQFKHDTVELGSISDMLSGGTPSSKHPEYYGDKYPFVTTPCLGKNYINENDAVNWLSESGVQNSSTHIIPAYSVMYGNRVGVGKSSINTCEMCTNQDILSFFNIDTSKYDLLFIKKVMDQYFDYIDTQKRGATIKGVPSDIVKSIRIPAAPIEEQRAFAEFTEQSDKSKFVRFKSQFIEMFGEPGKDDKGWGLTTLGECCELNPKRPRDIKDELLVSFVPMPAVSEDGKIDCSDIRPYKEVRKGFTYFAENDVLYAKITPCMENGKGAVAKGLEGGIGSGSTEFHVLRPIAGKSNPYWLYIITMFESFRLGAKKVMTGTGGQLRVPIGYLKDYPISLPPIELQNSFEEFVHQSDKSK